MLYVHSCILSPSKNVKGKEYHLNTFLQKIKIGRKKNMNLLPLRKIGQFCIYCFCAYMAGFCESSDTEGRKADVNKTQGLKS